MLPFRSLIGIAVATVLVLGCQNRQPASLLESCVRGAAHDAGHVESVIAACDVLVESTVVAVPDGVTSSDAFISLGVSRQAAASLATQVHKPGWCVIQVHPREPVGQKPRNGEMQLRQTISCAPSSVSIETPLLATGRILKVTLVTGKGRSRVSALQGQSPATVESVKRTDIVEVSHERVGLVVHYRTHSSLRDCAAQVEEMPQVWEMVVKERLNDPAITRVVLFPEETSGQSVGFAFSKDSTENWKDSTENWGAAAPCSITISGSGRAEGAR